jgi:hypothetical protein
MFIQVMPIKLIKCRIVFYLVINLLRHYHRIALSAFATTGVHLRGLDLSDSKGNSKLLAEPFQVT